MGLLHPDLQEFLQLRSKTNASELKAVFIKLTKEIEARTQLGAPTSFDFFLSAVKALSQVQGAAHAELRLSCLFHSGLYFYSIGRDENTLSAGRLMVALAERVQDRNSIRKAHTLCGVGNAHMGNVADAVVHYAQALPISRELRDIEGEVSCLSNLGAALNYGGLFREAIPCFVKASLLSRELPDADLEASCWCNLAQSYLQLEEVDKAFDAINRSLAKSFKPRDAIHSLKRAVREMTFVQVALELRELNLAKEHLLLCEEFCARCGTPRSKLIAKTGRGLFEVYAGDVSAGLLFLEEALLVAQNESAVEHADVLAAMVKAYDHAGRPELALARMQQLLAHIKTTREKGVLALMSLSTDEMRGAVAGDTYDLAPLRTKEAELRAKVAELSAYNYQIEMLERLAVTADLKEDQSGEHGYRVGKLASLLASELSWTAEAAYALEMAGRLHDIGKIGIPDRILFSSKELLQHEREFVSAHAVIGSELLGKSNVPQLRLAEEIARFHHEWWNGEGYPARLAGKRIPIHARIVALADVFDALTHGRSYSPSWSTERAIAEIRSRAGSQFDPELTEIFIALIEKLAATHPNLDAFLGNASRGSTFLQARNNIRKMLVDVSEAEIDPVSSQAYH